MVSCRNWVIPWKRVVVRRRSLYIVSPPPPKMTLRTDLEKMLEAGRKMGTLEKRAARKNWVKLCDEEPKW